MTKRLFPFSHMSAKRLSASLAALTLVAGCSFIPDFKRPAAPVPERFAGAGDTSASAVPGWQAYFTDPALRTLIEAALANNRDMRIALARVEEARAARSLMQGATPAWYVIDVRDARAFATRGHLPGAALVPLEVLEANVADLHVRTDQIVLVYADDEARAVRAARILAGYGFPNLRVLGGGMAAWERESLPVEKQ